jgi:hypothetical protein
MDYRIKNNIKFPHYLILSRTCRNNTVICNVSVEPALGKRRRILLLEVGISPVSVWCFGWKFLILLAAPGFNFPFDIGTFYEIGETMTRYYSTCWLAYDFGSSLM